MDNGSDTGGANGLSAPRRWPVVAMGLVILYLAVLGLAVFGVHSLQNAKTEQVKKDLASEQQRSQRPDEGALVIKNAYQAIFISNGQAYFAKIETLNERFVTISDIYYLRTGAAVQAGQANGVTGDVALTKLGCELHGPADKMVINRDQVLFWENLKADGKVAKAIAQHKVLPSPECKG